MTLLGQVPFSNVLEMSHEPLQSLDSKYGVLKGPFWFSKEGSSALNRKKAKTETVAFVINNALSSAAKICKDNISE